VFFVWYRTVIDFAAIIIFKTFIFIYKDQFRINLNLNALISYFSGYLVLQLSSSMVLRQQSGWTHPGGLVAPWSIFLLLLLMQAGCWLEVWKFVIFDLIIELLSRMNCKFVIFDLRIELLVLSLQIMSVALNPVKNELLSVKSCLLFSCIGLFGFNLKNRTEIGRFSEF